MSYLKEKSEFNIESAKELIEKSYYASSVHCSYYGCFQYLKHILKNYRNTTYEIIESDCFNYKLGGTHGYIIDNVLIEFKKKESNVKEYVTLKRLIKDLKKFRTDSDYFNIQVLSSEAEKSLQFSQTIIQTIKSNFK